MFGSTRPAIHLHIIGYRMVTFPFHPCLPGIASPLVSLHPRFSLAPVLAPRISFPLPGRTKQCQYSITSFTIPVLCDYICVCVTISQPNIILDSIYQVGTMHSTAHVCCDIPYHYCNPTVKWHPMESLPLSPLAVMVKDVPVTSRFAF